MTQDQHHHRSRATFSVWDESGNEHALEDQMGEDIIRVLRIIEITGPRRAVEHQVENSITGQKTVSYPSGDVIIRAATIGTYPEILDAACVVQKLTGHSTPLADCGHPRREGGGAGRNCCTHIGCINYVPF